MHQKLRYLLSSTAKTLRHKGFDCPCCGASRSVLISRKNFVTCLRRCSSCSLMFRAPTTTPEASHTFYQRDYDSGFTTNMPSPEALKAYVRTGFADTPKDFRRYIDVLKVLGAKPGDRILDFGCSWGYGTWQLKQHGFDAIGHDVSETRVAYARGELGVDAKTDLSEVEGKFG